MYANRYRCQFSEVFAKLLTCFFLRLASASAKLAARSSRSCSVGFSEEEVDNGRFLLNCVYVVVVLT